MCDNDVIMSHIDGGNFMKMGISALCLTICLSLAGCESSKQEEPAKSKADTKRNKAIELLDQGKLEQSKKIFTEIKNDGTSEYFLSFIDAFENYEKTDLSKVNNLKKLGQLYRDVSEQKLYTDSMKKMADNATKKVKKRYNEAYLEKLSFCIKNDEYDYTKYSFDIPSEINREYEYAISNDVSFMEIDGVTYFVAEEKYQDRYTMEKYLEAMKYYYTPNYNNEKLSKEAQDEINYGMMQYLLTYISPDYKGKDYKTIIPKAEKIIGSRKEWEKNYKENLERNRDYAIKFIPDNQLASIREFGEQAKEQKDEEMQKKKIEPAIGMTEEEIISGMWGSPKRKNKDEYSWGTEEQWVYPSRGYIYFKNGIVTSIQHR